MHQFLYSSTCNMQCTINCTVYQVLCSVPSTVQRTRYCTVCHVLYIVLGTVQCTRYYTLYQVMYSVLGTLHCTRYCTAYSRYCTRYCSVYTVKYNTLLILSFFSYLTRREHMYMPIFCIQILKIDTVISVQTVCIKGLGLNFIINPNKYVTSSQGQVNIK